MDSKMSFTADLDQNSNNNHTLRSVTSFFFQPRIASSFSPTLPPPPFSNDIIFLKRNQADFQICLMASLWCVQHISLPSLFPVTQKLDLKAGLNSFTLLNKDFTSILPDWGDFWRNLLCLFSSNPFFTGVVCNQWVCLEVLTVVPAKVGNGRLDHLFAS